MPSNTTVSPASNIVPAIAEGGLSGSSSPPLGTVVGPNTNGTNPGVLRTVSSAGALVTTLPGVSPFVTTILYNVPLNAARVTGVV